MNKVIVADNSAALRRLICATLEGENCRVSEATNSTEVLHAAGEQHPDLILLDALLPDLNGTADGIDVCRALKAAPATADIRILMLADGSLPQQREQLTNAGADYCLMKPFSPLQLLKLAEAALAHSST
jgi:CheY-like chemotaxis protein